MNCRAGSIELSDGGSSLLPMRATRDTSVYERVVASSEMRISFTVRSPRTFALLKTRNLKIPSRGHVRKVPVDDRAGTMEESKANEDLKVQGSTRGGDSILPLHVSCNEP